MSKDDFLDKAQDMMLNASSPQDMFDAINVINVGMRLWMRTEQNERIKKRLTDMVNELRAIRGDLMYDTLDGWNIGDDSGGHSSDENPWEAPESLD